LVVALTDIVSILFCRSCQSSILFCRGCQSSILFCRSCQSLSVFSILVHSDGTLRQSFNILNTMPVPIPRHTWGFTRMIDTHSPEPYACMYVSCLCDIIASMSCLCDTSMCDACVLCITSLMLIYANKRSGVFT
jgi:hypothetical protein